MRVVVGFLNLLALFYFVGSSRGISTQTEDHLSSLDEEALFTLEKFVSNLDTREGRKWKRDTERGVTNMDIRDAILQLLNLIRDGNKKVDKHEFREKQHSERVLQKMEGSSSSLEKKIDNISTFLLRMKNKLDSVERAVKKKSISSGGTEGKVDGSSINTLQTLATESFDILSVLPTYIESTKNAVLNMSKDSGERLSRLEYLLVDDAESTEEVSNSSSANGNSTKSLAKALKMTESHILNASTELKNMLIESGYIAENLYERVSDGYDEISEEIKGLSNVEKVLLDTADGVMDTKRKLEFGVQQIIYKVSELIKSSGGQIDDNLKERFENVTREILQNQNEALGNLTKKVEKEIGQVWRQMGIMYGQVSNSISILEKVKDQTETYVNKTGKNLGEMEGTVEGLTDSMVNVDTNLNYMLGQLSLVVTEFNQVKSGLSDAMSGLGDELEEIKRYEGDN